MHGLGIEIPKKFLQPQQSHSNLLQVLRSPTHRDLTQSNQSNYDLLRLKRETSKTPNKRNSSNTNSNTNVFLTLQETPSRRQPSSVNLLKVIKDAESPIRTSSRLDPPAKGFETLKPKALDSIIPNTRYQSETAKLAKAQDRLQQLDLKMQQHLKQIQDKEKKREYQWQTKQKEINQHRQQKSMQHNTLVQQHYQQVMNDRRKIESHAVQDFRKLVELLKKPRELS